MGKPMQGIGGVEKAGTKWYNNMDYKKAYTPAIIFKVKIIPTRSTKCEREQTRLVFKKR